MSRHYPDRPLVGVLAVVRREGRVLLVQRARPPYAGWWGFPGGAQELGETVFEAVTREILEETGLRVEPLASLPVLDTIIRDDEGRVATHWTLIPVLCEWRGGEVVLDDEATDFGWFGAEDLPVEDIPVIQTVGSVIEAALAVPPARY